MVAPTRIGIKEASAQLDALVDRIQRGEVIDLLRDGRPVARLGVIDEADTPPEASERLADSLRDFRRGVRLRLEASGQPPITVEEIVGWVREGREGRPA